MSDRKRPVRKGDLFPWDESSTRIVLDVWPYTGLYKDLFNVVLVLSSPQTKSGRIEMAYEDPALRAKNGP
jgi:hypothetical protein